MRATRKLIMAYPRALCMEYAGILHLISEDFENIKTNLSLPGADTIGLLERLNRLGTKLGDFQDRLQRNPPSVSFAARLRPLTGRLSIAEDNGSTVAAAIEVLNENGANQTTMAVDMDTYYSLRSSALADAINSHFNEGNMVPVLRFILSCLGKNNLCPILRAGEQGKYQRIALLKPSADYKSFHEEDAGELLQPTVQEPENKSFSLCLNSAQLTNDPIGWLAEYYRIFEIDMMSSNSTLAQQALQKGISAFSVSIGHGGIIKEIELTFLDSSTLKLGSG